MSYNKKYVVKYNYIASPNTDHFQNDFWKKCTSRFVNLHVADEQKT